MHDQTGFYKDADGRIVSNGCTCRWVNHDRESRRNFRGSWQSTGCPVHDPKAARAAAPRHTTRSGETVTPAG